MSTKSLAMVHTSGRVVGGKAVNNRILQNLPESEYRRLRDSLEYVTLASHQIIHEPNEKTKFLYFPNTGMLSIVIVTRNGRTAETGIVGMEGFVGLGSVVGLPENPFRVIVQIDGSGFKIAADVVHDALRSAPQLQNLFSRYAVLYGLQVSQTAACNRLHDSEQRLARWLLMTHDRIDSDELRITQDFLATMLGTDRPSITLAAQQLKRKKVIAYSRGSVKILNRKKLEAITCECYETVHQFNRDLGLK